MLFHFDHVEDKPVLAYDQESTDLSYFKKTLFRWQKLNEDSWGALYYENHNQPRSLPRFAPTGDLREMAAKSLAVSLLFQKGTPFIYQGQKLGMTNCDFEKADYRDIEAINKLKEAREISAEEELRAEAELKRYARDHARTPMQWSSDENAGFTTGTSWMKINDNYMDINAENQINNENSVYNFYKKVLSIRKRYADIISKGEFIPVGEENKEVFAFIRKLDDKKLLVVCSLSPNEAVFDINENVDNAKLVLMNCKDVEELSNSITFPACTCAVWGI